MAIVLSTPPFTVFYDDNGNPLTGGKVYTYTAGTLTPRVTYTDQGGLTSNANPVVLDVSGRGAIWLDNAFSYKFIVKTSGGDTLSNGTIDNITPFNTSSSSGLANIGSIAANTLVGNNTGSSAIPTALTVAQVNTMLAVSTSSLLISNNLSDVANITTARTNLAAAPLDSPPLTGTPTAPTQTAGNNTTRIATTAFVTAAVAAGSGTVTSVATSNGITGGTITTTGTISMDTNNAQGVGSYSLARHNIGSTILNGVTASGSNLLVILFNSSGYAVTSGGALSGTWRNVSGGTIDATIPGLFIRTA